MSNYATYGGINYGTPMMTFSLEMALAPGMGESTTLKQLAKALAYWQNVAATSHDGNLVSRANTAIGWIQTESARIQGPPANTLVAIVPV